MSNKKVLIVGAGVGGLAAAWWLARNGWQPTLLERAASLRSGGYMLGLSGSGYRVVDRMGLLPALRRHHLPINENVYRARDGQVLWRAKFHELLGDLDWITLSRTDLVQVLHDAVRAQAEIRFGVTVTAIEPQAERVSALLSDGSRFEADLLIGADGVHSTVRRMLFGPDSDFVRPLGYRCAAFQTADDLGLGHDFLSYAEPGRLAEFYTLAAGRLATLYAWRAQPEAAVAGQDRAAVLRSAFENAHPEALHYIDALTPDTPLYFDDLEMIEMPSWVRGRALLLGDAAHCLTLISGQGAGMALTGACILSQELAEATEDRDLDAALRRYQTRLRPAIDRLQARSRKIAPMFIPATERGFTFRNLIMRYSPPRFLAWYLAKSVRAEADLASLKLEPG